MNSLLVAILAVLCLIFGRISLGEIAMLANSVGVALLIATPFVAYKQRK